MAYENEEKRSENNSRRLVATEDNNPWITETPEDLNRQSSKIADTYIKT
jgi:hypothetical protein